MRDEDLVVFILCEKIIFSHKSLQKYSNSKLTKIMKA